MIVEETHSHWSPVTHYQLRMSLGAYHQWKATIWHMLYGLCKSDKRYHRDKDTLALCSGSELNSFVYNESQYRKPFFQDNWITKQQLK